MHHQGYPAASQPPVNDFWLYPDYLAEGAQLLELAGRAYELFRNLPPREQRQLLDFLVSNCTWRNGELTATFRQPFDMLVETATAASGLATVTDLATAINEIWLPGPDSNQRPSG